MVNCATYGLVLHQPSQKTLYNRYPEVFRACANLVTGSIRICSFGCSDGTEVQTLRQLYFPDAEIHGVEIDSGYLARCQRFADGSTFFSDAPSGMYNLIFCMSVLCRWMVPGDVYTFPEFDAQLVELDGYLLIGGLLVIYNSGFRFFDSSIYVRYEPVGEFDDSGFVTKFDLQGTEVSGYRHVIFRKIR